MPLTLHIVRHGQSVSNREGRLQGQADVALSELGLEQAQLAADLLAEKPIGAVISSDLRRALQTAAPIAAAHDLEVMPNPGLREQRFGRYEGILYAKLADDPMAFMLAEWANVDVAEHGGETYRQVYDRVAATIDAIVADPPAPELAIVSHGGAIRAMLAHLGGVPVEEITTLAPRNASIQTVVV
jgi:2,3-bisphosphoglycerate-dependent phosphoglycerate mutase